MDLVCDVFVPNKSDPEEEHPYYYVPSNPAKHMMFGSDCTVSEAYLKDKMFKTELDSNEDYTMYGLSVDNEGENKAGFEEDFNKYKCPSKMFENVLQEDGSYKSSWTSDRISDERLGSGFPVIFYQPGYTGNTGAVRVECINLSRMGFVVVVMQQFGFYNRKIGNTAVDLPTPADCYANRGTNEPFNGTRYPGIDTEDRNHYAGVGGIDPLQDFVFTEEKYDLFQEQWFGKIRMLMESTFGEAVDYSKCICQGSSFGWPSFQTLNRRQSTLKSKYFLKEDGSGYDLFGMSGMASYDGSNWSYAWPTEGEDKTIGMMPYQDGLKCPVALFTQCQSRPNASNNTRWLLTKMGGVARAQSMVVQIPGFYHADNYDGYNPNNQYSLGAIAQMGPYSRLGFSDDYDTEIVPNNSLKSRKFRGAQQMNDNSGLNQIYLLCLWSIRNTYGASDDAVALGKTVSVATLVSAASAGPMEVDMGGRFGAFGPVSTERLILGPTYNRVLDDKGRGMDIECNDQAQFIVKHLQTERRLLQIDHDGKASIGGHSKINEDFVSLSKHKYDMTLNNHDHFKTGINLAGLKLLNAGYSVEIPTDNSSYSVEVAFKDLIAVPSTQSIAILDNSVAGPTVPLFVDNVLSSTNVENSLEFVGEWNVVEDDVGEMVLQTGNVEPDPASIGGSSNPAHEQVAPGHGANVLMKVFWPELVDSNYDGVLNLKFDYFMETEKNYDFFTVRVRNLEDDFEVSKIIVKSGAESGSVVCPMSTSTYCELSYTKDGAWSGGRDVVRVKNFIFQPTIAVASSPVPSPAPVPTIKFFADNVLVGQVNGVNGVNVLPGSLSGLQTMDISVGDNLFSSGTLELKYKKTYTPVGKNLLVSNTSPLNQPVPAQVV